MFSKSDDSETMETRLETVLSLIATTATSLILRLFIIFMNGLSTTATCVHYDLRCRLKDFCKLRFEKVPFHELILAIGLAVPVHPLHKFTVQPLIKGRRKGGRERRREGRREGGREGGKKARREGRERRREGERRGEEARGRKEKGPLVNEST